MVQSNFVDNVRHDDSPPRHDTIITNAELMADMAASLDHLGGGYVSASEIKVDPGSTPGLTIKFEGEEKNLYQFGIKCEPDTLPNTIIAIMDHYRPLSMGPDTGFQFHEHFHGKDEDFEILH